jgi:toxin ParE1/3/4
MGEKQTLEYIEELKTCFEKIATTPDIGRDVSEFSPNLKRYNYKAHSIFYVLTSTAVMIVRILGKKQDFQHHL